MERALGSCKEENMICKVAKSSKGAMHWTRQSNEMNNQNSSKMRRISVCLYWTLISHYWPLLIIIKKLLPNSVRANVLQDIHMQFCQFSNLLSVFLDIGVPFANSLQWSDLLVVASSWLSCRRFKAMSIVGIYP